METLILAPERGWRGEVSRVGGAGRRGQALPPRSCEQLAFTHSVAGRPPGFQTGRGVGLGDCDPNLTLLFLPAER